MTASVGTGAIDVASGHDADELPTVHDGHTADVRCRERLAGGLQRCIPRHRHHRAAHGVAHAPGTRWVRFQRCQEALRRALAVPPVGVASERGGRRTGMAAAAERVRDPAHVDPRHARTGDDKRTTPADEDTEERVQSIADLQGLAHDATEIRDPLLDLDAPDPDVCSPDGVSLEVVQEFAQRASLCVVHRRVEVALENSKVRAVTQGPGEGLGVARLGTTVGQRARVCVNPEREQRGFDRIDVDLSGLQLLDQEGRGRPHGRDHFAIADEIIRRRRVMIVDRQFDAARTFLQALDQRRVPGQPRCAADVDHRHALDGVDPLLIESVELEAVAVHGEEVTNVS